MSRDRYGGYGGFGGLGRVEYTPYEPPVRRPEVILKFLGNSWTNSDEMDAAVLDAPRQFPIESIYFGPDFSIHEYVDHLCRMTHHQAYSFHSSFIFYTGLLTPFI